MTAPEDHARRVAEVARLTRLGYSAHQIAERLHVTSRTVTRDRVAAGISHGATTPLTEDQLATARQLLDDGASLEEAARTIGCHSHTLRRRWPEAAWTWNQVSVFANFVRRHPHAA